jgi:hypothetical protein
MIRDEILNIFNFSLTTISPILFKFGMIHLWDKGDFQVSYPLGAFEEG